MVEKPGGQAASSDYVVVRYGRAVFRLRAGEELSFGRGEDRDIRIGYAPRDDLVSRAAGVILGLDDGALVRNTSRTQSLRFVAMPGPWFPLRPGMAVGTMPHRQVRLEVLGRYGRVYPLHLDLRGLAVPDRGRPEAHPRSTSSTAYGPDQLSPRELRLLAALCEPLLTLAGSEPSSYREIAERLGGTATASSVRTGLNRLRNRLADEYGIPGLRSDEDTWSEGRDATHFVAALAQWAIDTGQVDAGSTMLLLPPR
jgi:hypothetical protein